MKIAAFFNAYTAGMSGGDKRALLALRSFQRLGAQITVYAPASFGAALREHGLEAAQFVPTAPEGEQGGLLVRYLARTKRCIRLLSRAPAAELHYATSGFLPDVLPALWARRKSEKSRAVGFVHHIVESWRTRPGSRARNVLAALEQRLSLRLLRRADAVLTENPLLPAWLCDHGFARERVHLVGLGVDLAAVDAAEPRGDFDAVFLARLVPSKGVEELGAIWQQVTQRFPQARLAVVGRGEEETVVRLQKELHERGLEKNVRLLGFLPTQESYGLLRGARVFLLPSHEEGWGLVVAEAMAAQCAVVAYELPVFPPIFFDVPLYAPCFDTQALAARVTELLADEEACARRGEAGRRLVEQRYTWERVAREEWEILCRLGERT